MLMTPVTLFYDYGISVEKETRLRFEVGPSRFEDSSRRLNLPRDLREWVTTGELITWVEEEVQQLIPVHHQLLTSMGRSSALPAKTMLSLLVFSYATQVFSSQEIVHSCYSDVAFRLLCTGPPPFPYELVRFRRRNRTLIASILEAVIIRALKYRGDCNGNASNPVILEKSRDWAVERLNIARHMEGCDD
jgi:hypothetical protein